MIFLLCVVMIFLGFLFHYKKLFHLSIMFLIVWNSVLVFFLVGTNELGIFFPETVLIILSILGFVVFQDLFLKTNENKTEIDQG